MKTSTVLVILGVGVVAYLVWTGMAVGNLQWIVEGVNIGAQGLTTELTITFTVQNPSSSTININNGLITVSYQGIVLGTGLVSGSIPSGTSQLSVTVVMSDISILSAANNILQAGSGNVLTISGKGLANGLAGSFTTSYTL